MIVRLLSNINRNKIKPVVLIQKKGKLYKRLNDMGIELHVVPLPTFLRDFNLSNITIPKFARSLFGVFQFAKEAWELFDSADVIWCHNLRAILLSSPFILTHRTPVVWNVGLGRFDGKRNFLAWFALLMTNKVFIESEQQLERNFDKYQRKIFREKFEIFYKGIDTSYFSKSNVYEMDLSKADYHVGTAASIIPRKGIDDFVRVAERVLEERDDTHFFIAGKTLNSEYKSRVDDIISQRGLEDDITFLGWIDEMPAYLDSLDVFLLLSSNEGIPGAVREAMSMEVPVIATDVGGTNEAVLHEETGYLVQYNESKKAAYYTLKLLEDDDLRSKLGHQGREHMVANFSLDNFVSDYEGFLQRLKE